MRALSRSGQKHFAGQVLAILHRSVATTEKGSPLGHIRPGCDGMGRQLWGQFRHKSCVILNRPGFSRHL